MKPTAVAVVAAAAALVTPRASAGPQAGEVTFSLAVHVAKDGADAVVTEDWVDARMAETERLFGPVGVHFTRGKLMPLDARFAHLETRKDRDALAAIRDKGQVSVFVTGSLRDVDDPRRTRQGVHWRPTGDPSRHYVIVSAVAMQSTLAHELGHFFGNGHTQVRDNLMSYLRTGADVSLDAAQKKKIPMFAGIFLRSRELWPVAPP